MRVVVLIAFSVFIQVVCSQPSLPHVYDFGHWGDEECVFFQEVDELFYYIGTTSSTAEGQTDGFFHVTDMNLNHVHTNVFGTPGVEQVVGAVYANQHFYVLVNQLNFSTNYDATIWCLDTEGNVMWVTNPGTDDWEFGSRIRFSNDLIWVPVNSTSGSLLMIMDLEGEIVDIIPSASPHFSFKDVLVLSEQVFLSGETTQLDGTIRNGSVFILNEQSNQIDLFYDSGYEGSYNCIFNREEELVVAGRAWQDSAGFQTIFWTGLDFQGQKLWEDFGMAEGEVVDGTLIDGNYLFAAYNSTFAEAENDFFLFQTNYIGQYAGVVYFDGVGNDLANGLFFTEEGHYVMTGKSSSYDGPDFNAHVIFHGVIPQGIFQALQPPVTSFFSDILEVEYHLIVDREILLYPNPVSDQIFSDLPISSLKIYSVGGEMIFDFGNELRHQFLFDYRPNDGLYIAVFTDAAGGVHRQKLMITNH